MSLNNQGSSKLNLGCGYNKKPGFLNVDQDSICRPDQVVDLEKTPWPFADNQFDEVLADHVMEHLGESSKTWLDIWKEIYRVCAHDAAITITVPHPRHDNFLIDPTHVRPVLPGTIAMFDQMRNIRDFEQGGQETKLGLMCDIDIEVTDVAYNLTEAWNAALREGHMSEAELPRLLSELSNVCYEIRIQARVIKPMRGQAWLESRAGG